MNCAMSILHLISPQAKVCEIGIRRADSTLAFLEMGCFVYMVDPWQDYPEYNEKNYNYKSDYEETLIKIEPYKGNYQIIRKKSDDALDDTPNDLDLVYIDGNHAYSFVKRDINNYWQKVKSGGWLTGDDYSTDGPKEAVDEFINSMNLKLEIYHNNWAVQKL